MMLVGSKHCKLAQEKDYTFCLLFDFYLPLFSSLIPLNCWLLEAPKEGGFFRQEENEVTSEPDLSFPLYHICYLV